MKYGLVVPEVKFKGRYHKDSFYTKEFSAFFNDPFITRISGLKFSGKLNEKNEKIVLLEDTTVIETVLRKDSYSSPVLAYSSNEVKIDSEMQLYVYQKLQEHRFLCQYDGNQNLIIFANGFDFYPVRNFMYEAKRIRLYKNGTVRISI